jgi:hypothetical protein
MNVTPFLPGLILALAVWIIPLPIRFIPDRFNAAFAKRFPWTGELAPWIHSLGLPYAGLILGWISARDYGLTGQTILEWALGAAAAILLGLILAWVSVRFADPRGWGDARAEARWCLYRAAAWPLVNFLPVAAIAGLLASLVEFSFGKWKESPGFSRATVIPFLARTAGSTALFLMAHNFFLALVYYWIAFIASKPEFLTWIKNTRARTANSIPNQRAK